MLKELLMISLAAATSFISPVLTICMIIFPIAVASTGPVMMRLPVASAVSRFSSSSRLPPPMMWMLPNVAPVLASSSSIAF